MLRISLFGKFSARSEQGLLDDARSPRALELFAYLLLRRDRSHSREALGSVLWGDSSPNQEKKYLRNTLWQLQRVLTDSFGNDENPIMIRSDSIGVKPDAKMWIDVEVFEAAHETVKDKRGSEMTEDQAAALATAIELYKGHLVEGWFHEWCLADRERFIQILLLMLDKMIEYSEVRKDFESGIMFGERALSIDWAREVTHQNLMRLLYLSGDRTGALRQYELCKSTLKRELDVEPSEITETLAEAIRNDQFGF